MVHTKTTSNGHKKAGHSRHSLRSLDRRQKRLPDKWCPNPDSNRDDQRSRDFKSPASTDFAIRAVALKKRGWTIYSPGAADKAAAIYRPQRKSPVDQRSTGLFYTGGRYRNRTDVNGFAIRCITTLLIGLKRRRRKKRRQRQQTGAGNETRTRDPDLGKVVLYQLSYSRVLVTGAILYPQSATSTP